jgi:hypothetical protein
MRKLVCLPSQPLRVMGSQPYVENSEWHGDGLRGQKEGPEGGLGPRRLTSTSGSHLKVP